MIRSFEYDLRLRFITQPYQGQEHRYQSFEPVRCARGPSLKCPMCLIPNYASTFYLLGAIDRADGNYYVFKFERDFFLDIRKLYMNPTWGDPQTFDIQIGVKSDKNGKPAPTVIPLPKRELSQQDLEIQKNVDKEFLITNTAPYPLDCVKGFMRRNKIVRLKTDDALMKILGLDQ